jgi:membrane fusion protein (multidrug efflux system)
MVSQTAPVAPGTHDGPIISSIRATSAPWTSPSSRIEPFCCAALLILLMLTAAPATVGAADQPPAQVAVARIFEQVVAPTAALAGNVIFDHSAGISSQISGLIAGYQMTEGRVVRRGDVLVRLNTDFATRDVAELEQQIAQVDLKIENAQKNLKRFATLYRQDATTEKNYDDLVFQVKELQVEKRRLQVTLGKKQLELEKSLIRAPFNGLVLKRYKSEGEWVSPGDPVCQLAAIDDVVVQVALSEELIPYVHVGQSLTLSITTVAASIQGKVKTVTPSVNAKSKTFDIKIGIDYHAGLFENMSALVNIPTGPARKLKMIKRGALVRYQGGEFVYTVQDGRAKILPIQVSAVVGEYLAVDTPHITAGMPVVVDGNERLRPDQPVTIVESPGRSSAPQPEGKN